MRPFHRIWEQKSRSRHSVQHNDSLFYWPRSSRNKEVRALQNSSFSKKSHTRHRTDLHPGPQKANFKIYHCFWFFVYFCCFFWDFCCCLLGLGSYNDGEQTTKVYEIWSKLYSRIKKKNQCEAQNACQLLEITARVWTFSEIVPMEAGSGPFL